MYCSNCGKKLNDNADVCVNCGVLVNKEESKTNINIVNNNSVNKEKKKSGLSIASLVVGIIAIYYSLSAYSVDIDLTGEDPAYIFGYAIGIVLIQSILAIVSLILSLVDMSKNKSNGFNIAGLVLSIITFVLSGILFLLVLAQ